MKKLADLDWLIRYLATLLTCDYEGRGSLRERIMARMDYWQRERGATGDQCPCCGTVRETQCPTCAVETVVDNVRSGS